MVQAVINISEHTNRVLNIVKAKYGLKDKSEAINAVVEMYERDAMEPELRPEYAERIDKIGNEGSEKVDSFARRYGLDK